MAREAEIAVEPFFWPQRPGDTPNPWNREFVPARVVSAPLTTWSDPRETCCILLSQGCGW